MLTSMLPSILGRVGRVGCTGMMAVVVMSVVAVVMPMVAVMVTMMSAVASVCSLGCLVLRLLLPHSATVAGMAFKGDPLLLQTMPQVVPCRGVD